MNQIEQLMDNVEQYARTRPRYSPASFLRQPVFELAVLLVLEEGEVSGDAIVRQLKPMAKWAATGYGAHYPLLHQLTADGSLSVEHKQDTNRRCYSLTAQGRERLEQLRTEYNSQTTGSQQFLGQFRLVYPTFQTSLAERLFNPATLATAS